MTEYRVPSADYGEAQFTEKRSKFIGRLWHVDSADLAIEKINEMRTSYRDATHHCWAYLIREGNLMRYSDDGEPQGTAGLPILDVLRHEPLTDVCCVVTRYFGGTLLGKGGLVRAYTQGAQIAVAAAGVTVMRLFSIVRIDCPYALFDIIQTLLPAHDCVVDTTEYGAQITLCASLPIGGEEALRIALANASAGRVCAVVLESRFMGRSIP